MSKPPDPIAPSQQPEATTPEAATQAAPNELQNASSDTPAKPELWSDYGEPAKPSPVAHLWDDYGEASPPRTFDQLLQHVEAGNRDLLLALSHVDDRLRSAFAEKIQARLPVVTGNNAVLRVSFALYDVEGSIFDHRLDIPLTGFRSDSMRPLALSTVQAALHTLVLPQLVGAVTDYQETMRRETEFSERPLLPAPAPFQDEHTAKADVER